MLLWRKNIYKLTSLCHLISLSQKYSTTGQFLKAIPDLLKGSYLSHFWPIFGLKSFSDYRFIMPQTVGISFPLQQNRKIKITMCLVQDLSPTWIRLNKNRINIVALVLGALLVDSCYEALQFKTRKENSTQFVRFHKEKQIEQHNCYLLT